MTSRKGVQNLVGGLSSIKNLKEDWFYVYEGWLVMDNGGDPICYVLVSLGNLGKVGSLIAHICNRILDESFLFFSVFLPKPVPRYTELTEEYLDCIPCLSKASKHVYMLLNDDNLVDCRFLCFLEELSDFEQSDHGKAILFTRVVIIARYRLLYF